MTYEKPYKPDTSNPAITPRFQIGRSLRGVADRERPHLPMSTTSSSAIGQKLWISVRFVLFALIGFGVMLSSSFRLLIRTFEHQQESLSPFLSLPLTFVGAFMMLYGVGEWRRRAYLWVCLSIAISMFLLYVIPGIGSDKEFSIFAIAFVAFGSNIAVRAYYSSRV